MRLRCDECKNTATFVQMTTEYIYVNGNCDYVKQVSDQDDGDPHYNCTECGAAVYLEESDPECPTCGSPLQDNGCCSDLGSNNCQFFRGLVR